MRSIKFVFSIVCSLGLIFICTACGIHLKSQEQGVVTGVSQGTSSHSLSEKGPDSPRTETDHAIPSDRKNKALVAYFSCTGHTEIFAKYIAELFSADLYEIVPATPYTEIDLDYSNQDSRTSIEQNDPASRPEIAGTVDQMGEYDIIFLGYPIWWGQAPKIIYTFLESYSFSGKTIVPFCTSGSSEIGSSVENLHDLVSEDVTWFSGTRLDSTMSKEALAEWVDTLDW